MSETGADLRLRLEEDKEAIVKVLRAHRPPRGAQGRLVTVNRSWRMRWSRLPPPAAVELEGFVSAFPCLQQILALPDTGLLALFKKGVLPLPTDLRETTRVPSMLKQAALGMSQGCFVAEVRSGWRIYKGGVDAPPEVRLSWGIFRGVWDAPEMFGVDAPGLLLMQRNWKALAALAAKKRAEEKAEATAERKALSAKKRAEATAERKARKDAARAARVLASPTLNAAYTRLPYHFPGFMIHTASIDPHVAYEATTKAMTFQLEPDDSIYPRAMEAVAKSPTKSTKLLKHVHILSYRVYFQRAGGTLKGIVVEVMWSSKNSSAEYKSYERITVFRIEED